MPCIALRIVTAISAARAMFCNSCVTTDRASKSPVSYTATIAGKIAAHVGVMSIVLGCGDMGQTSKKKRGGIAPPHVSHKSY